jgi:signal transduction histidine kinase/DNA-binding response OmpR family regulator
MERDKSEICILVVDDEPGLRDLLSFELGSVGYKVTTTHDGVDAIQKIKNQKFDLVISDIKMPQMDGITFLKELKTTAPNMEVIMMTGFGTIEMAVTSMKEGAYDFIQKPFNLSEVMMLIDKALEKRQLKTLIALYETSRVVFSTIKLRDLFCIVIDQIQKVLKADEGSLMLLDEKGKLYIVASHGLDEEVVAKAHVGIGERIAGQIFKNKQGRLFIDSLAKYPEFSGVEPNLRIGSSIVLPLLHQSESFGVMNLARLKGHDNFDSSDFQSASIFASQVAQAVQNAKLYQSVEVKVEELKKAYQALEENKDRLVESEKLASIGRLVAGVAHEINNPLTVILGYMEMLLSPDINEGEEEIKKDLKIIFQEAQRCRKVVQDLLIFSRRQDVHFQSVNVNVLVEDVLRTLELEISRKQIQVKKNYIFDLLVCGDKEQLFQVFLNILKNAVDALGSIADNRTIEISLEIKDDSHGAIVIADNGSGIPEENIKRLFEPFFTTKEVGKGTGLGLSLSHGIIKQHGGSIEVKSDPGKETAFIIKLPLAKKTSDEKEVYLASDPAPRPPLNVVLKNILLVDDEEGIRNFVKWCFSDNGCLVEMASDGQEALEKMMKQDFDLVLCDYRIPKLNGLVLFQKIKELKPLMAKRFIYITGFTADKKLVDFFRENDLLYLAKPFLAKELFDIVEQKLKNREI